MSALALRTIACVAMLLDHIGFCWNIMPLRAVGRIAFPIFVFLIYNGFFRTGNRARYALRLAVFALISQIPFSLFVYGQIWHTNGNVFFTLTLALLCLWSVDSMLKMRFLRWFALLPSVVVCLCYHYGVLSSDYGAIGILLALSFYFFYKKGLIWRILLCACFLGSIYYAFCLSGAKQLLMLVLGMKARMPELSYWSRYQIFTVFALPLLFLYNGKKGSLPSAIPPKVAQYGFYLFYPVHQLALWFIRIF